MNVHDVKEKNRSVRISKAQKAYAHRHMRTTKCSSWRYDSICSDLMDMCLLLFCYSFIGRFHNYLNSKLMHNNVIFILYQIIRKDVKKFINFDANILNTMMELSIPILYQRSY